MSRVISTDLNILARPADWEKVSTQLPRPLREAGYDVASVHGEIVDLTCEPDNMLLTQFAQEQGHMPVTESLHRVIINGRSDLDLRAATAAVVAALPAGTYWYGTSHLGETEPGVAAACAWQDRS